jgi:hypothetical protein
MGQDRVFESYGENMDNILFFIQVFGLDSRGDFLLDELDAFQGSTEVYLVLLTTLTFLL